MGYFSDTYYVIFDVSELDKVNFETVSEDNINTVRLSLYGTKTFINWYGQIAPSFVKNLTTKSRIYSYNEVLLILTNHEWTLPLTEN